jgi:cobalt-zinc-cadmium efflux system protein
VSQRRRISLVLALNLAMIAGLAIAGFASRSLGLLSEAGDFLADSAALALGLYAIHRRDHHLNGNATTWVALINGLALLVLSVWVAGAAIVRLVHGGPEVHGLPVLIVSAIAAVVMLIAAFILGADAGSEDLHMRSIMLDTIADGAAAAVVAIVGGVIAFAHRWYWLDSAAACLVAAIIAVAAVRLLVDVVAALRSGEEYVPADND